MRPSSLACVCVLAACLTAVARSADPPADVFGLPASALQTGGALVLGGGGDLPDDVYDEFVRLAGGPRARLVLIPSAYDYGGDDRIRRAFGGWQAYDVVSFDFLHTDDPEDADDEDFCRVLEQATGVWIAGGAQSRLIYRYGETRVEKLLRSVVARGGVLGGTSAGASVMSRRMIRDGSATAARLDRGFGLTTRLIIDQHFSERGRFPRLLGVLESQPGHIGLGIDEDTAVIVQRNRLRVLGDGRAAICFGPVADSDGTTIHRLAGGDEATIVTSAPAAVPTLQLRRQEVASKK